MKHLTHALALVCAVLALCLSQSAPQVTSYAAGDDDTTWQGTVKVVTKVHDESDTTEYTVHRVFRRTSDTTAIYTGFRIQPENEEMRSWSGPAAVNLTTNESYYRFQTSTLVGPTGTDYEEHGYETTTTGATVAQGVVKFYRYRSQDDPRKTTCHIEVDAASDWRDRPELKVWEVGRRWSKTISPLSRTNWEAPVKDARTLAPTFVSVSFDCDPKAPSYSGHKETQTAATGQVVTWSLSHRPAETEAVIVPPDEYATWVPEGGENEDTPANAIVIRARVHRKGQPQKSSPEAAKFKFQLVEVSKEKGVCLNWPGPEDAKRSFDLKIQPELNDALKVAADGQSAESKGNLKESSIIITSYDWGAYGRLKVTAVYDDGREEDAHVEGEPSKDSLTIPKDDNDNHIADYWEKHYVGGKSGANADDDLIPIGDSHEGDGFSLYEEYRGFRARGEHIRTNPILKDLFVFDQNDLTLGAFAQSGLAVHLVEWKELGWESGRTNGHVMNGNRGFGTRGPQDGLILQNRKMDGLYGKAIGGPGTPKKIDVVAVDKAACLETSLQELETTIAHELAHACNVWHHGDSDYRILKFRRLNPDGSWGAWVTDPHGRQFSVSVKGGQESGVEECIMRYEDATFYETSAGDRQLQRTSGSLQRGADYGAGEAPGTVFCNDVKGTGVNAGGARAGDASKGKCSTQFCVNDHRH